MNLPQPWQIWWADLVIDGARCNQAILIASPLRPAGDMEMLPLKPERIHDPNPEGPRDLHNTPIHPEDVEPVDPHVASITWTYHIDGKRILYTTPDQLLDHSCTVLQTSRRKILDMLQPRSPVRDPEVRKTLLTLKNHIGRAQPPKTRLRYVAEARTQGVPARRKTRDQWLKAQQKNP